MTAPLTGSIPPPPRNIAGGLGFGIWLGRIATLLFIPLGLIVVLYLLLIILWACFQTEVPGRVTGGDIKHGSKGRTYYHLNYDYDVNGRHYSDQQKASASAYQRLIPGQNGMPGNIPTPVTIRHFDARVIQYSNIKEAESIASPLFWTSCGCLIANGFLALFAAACWIVPMRIRWLFINGLPAPAAVINKRSERSRYNTSYMVTIVYEHPVSHDRHEIEIMVDRKQDWDAAETGLIVTALCHPQEPKDVAVAEWGPYRIAF